MSWHENSQRHTESVIPAEAGIQFTVGLRYANPTYQNEMSKSLIVGANLCVRLNHA